MKQSSAMKRLIENAIGNTRWDVGNQVLYDLCSAHPKHQREDVIIAKVWLIGRAYSAAIERRRPDADGPRGDGYYEQLVAPKLRDSPLDHWLEKVSSDPSNRRLALKAHRGLTEVFKDISGLEKTSLASKYLHFHVPSAFFIYDSRARTAITKLTESRRGSNSGGHHYAPFYDRCLDLTEQIEALIGKRLSPREVDKVLLAKAEVIAAEKRLSRKPTRK